MRDSVQAEMKKEQVPFNSKIADNLRLLTGLKGIFVPCIVWGFTWFFAWFSYLSNGEELPEMVSSSTFNFVSFTIFTIPLFLFVSGFL